MFGSSIADLPTIGALIGLVVDFAVAVVPLIASLVS